MKPIWESIFFSILFYLISELNADPIYPQNFAVPKKLTDIKTIGSETEVHRKQDDGIIERSLEKTPRNAAAATAAAAAIVSLANVTLIKSGSDSCPPSHLFSPCECFVYQERARVISCTGEQSLDLNSIFQRLSIYLPKPEKHFQMFYLNNTNISYLGNVLHDITFEYICELFVFGI